MIAMQSVHNRRLRTYRLHALCIAAAIVVSLLRIAAVRADSREGDFLYSKRVTAGTVRSVLALDCIARDQLRPLVSVAANIDLIHIEASAVTELRDQLRELHETPWPKLSQLEIFLRLSSDGVTSPPEWEGLSSSISAFLDRHPSVRTLSIGCDKQTSLPLPLSPRSLANIKHLALRGLALNGELHEMLQECELDSIKLLASGDKGDSSGHLSDTDIQSLLDHRSLKSVLLCAVVPRLSAITRLSGEWDINELLLRDIRVDDIAGLDTLERLAMESCVVSGTVVRQLSSLVQLSYLSCHNCEYVGASLRDGPVLPNKLSDIYITSPAGLGQFERYILNRAAPEAAIHVTLQRLGDRDAPYVRRCTTLSCHAEFGQVLVAELAQAKSLKRLKLSLPDADASLFARVLDAPVLEEVDLISRSSSRSGVVEVPALASAGGERLTRISVQGFNDFGSLEAIWMRARNLRSVEFRNCALTEAVIKKVMSHKKINHISMSGCEIGRGVMEMIVESDVDDLELSANAWLAPKSELLTIVCEFMSTRLNVCSLTISHESLNVSELPQYIDAKTVRKICVVEDDLTITPWTRLEVEECVVGTRSGWAETIPQHVSSGSASWNKW